MTPDQRKHFYFPIWSQTSARLDWKMAGGRLLADLEAQTIAAERFPDHAANIVATVIFKARNLAATQMRAVVAEDLRHGCNFLASNGRYASSSKFTQRDLNQFDRMCAVLRDPWDFNATHAWLNPQEDDRQRTLKYLRKLSYDEQLAAISRNAFDTTDVDGLSQNQLDWMVQTVKSSSHRKYPHSTQAPAEQPF